MPDAPPPDSIPPPSPTGNRPSRQLNWTGIAIVLLSIAVVAAATLLITDIVRDRNADDVTLTTSSDDALRAEVTTFVEDYFDRLDEAYATGDPSKLDGLYPEGSALGEGQREEIEATARDGDRIERTSRIEFEKFTELSDERWSVEIFWVIESGQIRNLETGEIKQRQEQEDRIQAIAEVSREEGRLVMSELLFPETDNLEGSE